MNRLASEKSPYLLQHAHNPVDWYPWGEEAFGAARDLDRPIFLSVGYATCHWCHVMERECFEDPEVAGLMNAALVSVKVDREERPDVDEQYMTVCTLLTGSGGWPLTVVLTPEARPFFAATYLPKTTMLDLVPRIREIWTTRRDEVEKSAGTILEALRAAVRGAAGGRLPTADVLAKGFSELQSEYDEEHGGFGPAPKFPTPHNLTFLLRYHHRSRDARALRMAEETLTAMRRGGMYDHVGHGFHRYSTDRGWLVPHFEKMLYDQALLALAYLEAYQLTGHAGYAAVSGEVLGYVQRDLTLPEGGLASAEDADSEGVEGKFYVWSHTELVESLDPGQFHELARLSDVLPQGNYNDPFGHEGGNILHLPAAAGPALPEAIRRRLYERRAMRIRPLRDDKVLTDWNGLAMAAMARHARLLDDAALRGAAEGVAAFLLSRMREPGGALLHRYRDGEAAIPGYATDYAYLVWGLTELYECTLSVGYLRAAVELVDELVARFVVAEGAGLATLYLTGRDAEPLLVRPRGATDGALPSAASVAILDLFRVGRMTGRQDLMEAARSLLRSLAGEMERYPRSYTFALGTLDHLLGPLHEVVVTGEPDRDDTRALLEAARGVYAPGAVLLYRPPGDQELARIAPFVAPLEPKDGKATAYVCSNYTCSLPTTDPEVMLGQLRT
jgi:hypothetical protein